MKLAAIAALGKIGKDDSFNIMVPDMLIDDDPDVRIAAALALGEMKTPMQAPICVIILSVKRTQKWLRPSSRQLPAWAAATEFPFSFFHPSSACKPFRVFRRGFLFLSSPEAFGSFDSLLDKNTASHTKIGLF